MEKYNLIGDNDKQSFKPINGLDPKHLPKLLYLQLKSENLTLDKNIIHLSIHKLNSTVDNNLNTYKNLMPII